MDRTHVSSTDDANPHSIGRRTVGAGTWTVGARLVAKLIDLAMLLCLARFLGPAEFGLVATAMAAVFIIEALFDLPMAAALIRVPVLLPRMLDTAFTLSLLRGLLVGLLLLGAAWPLAAFNDDPRLVALLGVLALAPVMRGLVNPRMVEYARAFDFRPEAVMEVSGKAVAFCVSVGIAASTRSYWAIAAATVCAPMVSTLLSYAVAPLRPRLTLEHWPHFSDLVGWNFVAQLCAALNWQIDRLLLPRFTSAAAFGQYAMAKQVSEIPLQALMQPLTRPAMPALASASADARGTRYLKFSHALTLVMLPVFGLLALWPEVLVRLALGPNWAGAAPWLGWISVITVLSLPTVLLGPLAMTVDRTRWVALRTLVELLFRLPLVWWGVANHGIAGAIAASAIATVAGTLATLWIVRHLVGTGIVAQAMTLVRPLLALLPAAALLWLARPLVVAASGSFELLWLGAAFGLLYLLVYGLSTLVAWQLAGRPGGLEQHLIERVRTRLSAIGDRLRSRAERPPMESHVK